MQQQWSAYTKSHNGIMALAYTQISEFCINLQWTIPFAARDNSRTVRKKGLQDACMLFFIVQA